MLPPIRVEEPTVRMTFGVNTSPMRAACGDMEIRLTPLRRMSLDKAIEYLADDELLEVTPLNYYIRKQTLSTNERGKLNKTAKKAHAESIGG